MADELIAYAIAAGCFIAWGIICGAARTRRLNSNPLIGSSGEKKVKYSSDGKPIGEWCLLGSHPHAFLFQISIYFPF